MENNKLLTLFDAITQQIYSLIVSTEDHNKAVSDEYYAAALLDSAKQASIEEVTDTIQSDHKEVSSIITTYAEDGRALKHSDIASHWTRNEILQLIELYKTHSSQFKSSTIRNEVVWQSIAEKIPTHTAAQAQNKWKYLKSKFIKRKENMSSKGTGESPNEFEYFEEVNEILGSKPNIIPLTTASSLSIDATRKTKIDTLRDNVSPAPSSSTSGASSHCSISPSTSSTDFVDTLKRVSKGKRLSTMITELDQKMEAKEKRKEARHKESMLLKNEALEILRKVADKLIPNDK